MDVSEFSHSEETPKDLARAQKSLDDVENKMKKFKSRKKQQQNPSQERAPFPDLNKYFSYLSEQNLNHDIFDLNTFRKAVEREEFYRPFKSTLDKENNSREINQKPEKQKNSSINRIEEYYNQRNEALEASIGELKEKKEKVIKGQKLLLRNNEELEKEVDRTRKQREGGSRIVQELKGEVETMRNKIVLMEKDNHKIKQHFKIIGSRATRDALRGGLPSIPTKSVPKMRFLP